MPQAVVDAPDVSATVDRLMSGDVFTPLAYDRSEERAAGLETVLQAVVDQGTRVAWVGNPLRSPLTMERFLLQIVGPEIDLRVERSPAELARLIARRHDAESRLLVIVQQPETIDPETLEQLGALAGHFGEEAVQVQFLFSGSFALRLPVLARADLGHVLPLSASSVPPEMTATSGPRRRDVLPLILLLLVALLGVIVSLAPPAQEQAEAAASANAPPMVAERGTDAVRRHFYMFLAERADSLPPLSAAQKDALFHDFLTQHTRE